MKGSEYNYERRKDLQINVSVLLSALMRGNNTNLFLNSFDRFSCK